MMPSVDAIDALLPQTQCTRCGYPDCRRYAQAMADGHAEINQCPPGGAEGIARLAALTGRPVIPLNPANGSEGPVRVAVIDEDWCIGCTLCIKACPVDCIVGAAKHMHTVIEAQCTGCELCLPACPVDCIGLVDAAPGRTGWAAWSAEQAAASRERYVERNARRERQAQEQQAKREAKAQRKLQHLEELTVGASADDERQRRRAVIEAAMARARAQRSR